MTSALHDHAVRQRITTSGLDDTLFIEAGAGTGKTSQLVARVVNLVVDGEVELREVAAITFTEAAASELRDRIRAALEREADGPDERRARRCRAAIADVDRAAITTLHGFALRILSEHPFAVGLPPRLQVADEVTSQLAFEQRWERFVNALYATAEHQQLLERARLLAIPLEPRYTDHATLKDVAALLDQSWDRAVAIAGMTPPPLTVPDLSAVVATAEDLHAARQHCADDTDKLAAHLDRILPAVDAILADDDPFERLTTSDRKWRCTLGQRANWDVPVEEVRALTTALVDAADDVLARASDEALQQFKVLIAGEVLAGADARRREGLLEFHDLLVLALTALRTSPATRAALGARYRRLLLDEFQDTDPIQIELAVLIASAIGEDPPAPWHAVSVDAGRLFFVGDPKQSIYRFRRADIGLFLAARDRFGGTAGPLRLTTNFRTVPPILDWVNELFAQLMPVEVPGCQPRYEPLVGHRRASPGGDHRVVLLGQPTDGRAAEVRTAEAVDVAEVLADIRAHPERWPVDDGGWRPAELSDVTVLVPTRTSLPYLKAQLDARRIPFRLDTGTLVFATQEIRDVLSVVRAVDDPSDQIAVVAALRSPLYACSDVDLFTFLRSGGRWDPSRRPPDGLDEHPVGRAMLHLHELWRERWWMSPSDLVERIMRDRGAMLAGFGSDRPREVWRRLRFVLDQARAFESGGGGGLRAFTEWAELQRSSSSRSHEPLPADTDDRAVRIMTIHGAKGLEFPITILSGMSTVPTGRRRGVHATWNGDDLEVRTGRGVNTAQFDTRIELDEQMDTEERLRLLYVAATRARDHLVVSCHHQAPKGTPRAFPHGAQVFRVMGTPGHAASHRPFAVEPAGEGEVPVGVSPAAPDPAEGDRWREARRALVAGTAARRFTSATAIAAAAAEVADDEAVEIDDVVEHDDRAVDDAATADDEAAAPTITWRRGRAGTAIGRAVHATLQSVDLAVDPADAAIDAIARREAGIEALPEAAETVAAMARSALRSTAVGLARANVHHKELYVAAPIGGRVIEGYIDLLVETPDGLVVIDYKTDTVRSEAEVDAKLGRYELQGAAYVVALEQTTGLQVVDCRFVFCRPAGAIERAVADLDAARRRVRSALAGRPGVARAPTAR